MKLSRLEKRLARALYEGIYPASEALPHSIGELDIETFLDELARDWPPLNVLTFRATVWIVALGSHLVLRTVRPLWALSVEDRAKALHALQYGPLYLVRGMVTLLKASGGMLYGGAPEVRRLVAPGADNTERSRSVLVQLRTQRSS